MKDLPTTTGEKKKDQRKIRPKDFPVASVGSTGAREQARAESLELTGRDRTGVGRRGGKARRGEGGRPTSFPPRSPTRRRRERPVPEDPALALPMSAERPSRGPYTLFLKGAHLELMETVFPARVSRGARPSPRLFCGSGSGAGDFLHSRARAPTRPARECGPARAAVSARPGIPPPLLPATASAPGSARAAGGPDPAGRAPRRRTARPRKLWPDQRRRREPTRTRRRVEPPPSGEGPRPRGGRYLYRT